MQTLSLLEVKLVAIDPHLLGLSTHQMHLDAPDILVVVGVMIEGRRIQVRIQLPPHTVQQVQIERLVNYYEGVL